MLTFLIISAVCKAVGVSNTGIILDSQMTASSEYSSSYKPYYGRLHGTRGDGWCSRPSNSNNDWLQIDFGKTIQVCAVATMGDVNGDEWTTVFKLSFSTDGNTWKIYRDKQNVEMVWCSFANFCSLLVDQPNPFLANLFRAKLNDKLVNMKLRGLYKHCYHNV